MAAALELRLKRKVSHARYLTALHAERQHEFARYCLEFREEFFPQGGATAADQAQASPPQVTALVVTGNRSPMQHQQPPQQPSPLTKLLYSKLALVTHPDKGGTHFRELQAARAANDTAALVLLADQLGVLPSGDQLLATEWCRLVSCKEEELQQACAHFGSTLAWLWGTSDAQARVLLRPRIAAALEQAA